MFRSIHILALILIVVTSLTAQNPDTDVNVSVNFTIIGWSEGLEGISYKDGTKYNDVDIPSWRHSEEYKYQGPATLQFYNEANTEDGPIVSVRFDPTIKNYCILFAKEGPNHRALALPNDAENAPAGKARVFNFTQNDVALRYNNSGTIVLKPHESKILDAAGNNLLVIEMAYNEDQKWVKSGYRYIALPPSKQTTIFYVNNEADFFKTADGLTKKGPQSLILRQDVVSQ